MANRWLFAGGDIGMMRLLGAPTTNTTTTRRNTAYADHVIACTTGQGVYADFTDSALASDSVTSGETLWVRAFYYYDTSGTTAGELISLLDGSDQPWLSFRSTTTSNLRGLYYNSGTGGSPSWTLLGSTFSVSAGSLMSVDIKLTIGSPHSAEIFIDGTSVASGTFTQASLSTVHVAICRGTNVNHSSFSEIMATVGITTIGGHVFYGKPTGAGANSGWTGAATAIDDVGIDDTDMISSGTAGQKSTFAYADAPGLAAGYTFGDLFMWTRGKNDGSAPNNIKPVRRDSGGTDTAGSNFSGIGAGFGDFLTRYAGIGPTEYNASEFGVESVT